MDTPNLEVTLSSEKVSLPHGLKTWILDIKSRIGSRILTHLEGNSDHLDRYLECAEINELPGAYLCCSFYQRDMNDTFTRMGIFMGAGRGFRENTILPHDHPTLINYKKLVAGHNLPGPLLTRFFATLKREADPALAANAHESAFERGFLRSAGVPAHGDRFYVIGLSVQNMKSHESVVSHEVRHARYFLDETYRETVNRFWHDSVSREDRKQIINTLGQAYNTEQQELIIDEFQAYLLQSNAEEDRMKSFVSQYQHRLSTQLASQNSSLRNDSQTMSDDT